MGQRVQSTRIRLKSPITTSQHCLGESIDVFRYYFQSSQVSRIERESHSFQCNLTLSRRHEHFSRIGTILAGNSTFQKLSEVLTNSEFVPSLALNFGQCSICSCAINFLVSRVSSG